MAAYRGSLGSEQRTAFLPIAISYIADISACGKGQQCKRRQQTACLPNVISGSAPHQSLCKGPAMASGLGSCGSEAADWCSAYCHFLHSCLQCLREGPALAASLGSLGGGAAGGCSAQCHFLQCCYQCLWEGPEMASDAADCWSAQCHFPRLAVEAARWWGVVAPSICGCLQSRTCVRRSRQILEKVALQSYLQGLTCGILFKRFESTSFQV